MKSDTAWHAAHRASAWSIAVAGVMFLATAGLLVWRDWGPNDERRLVLGMTTLAVVVVLIGAVQAHLVAKKHQR
jgi:multisubunit Na+/H+ antiporter MnhG subunit